MTGSPSRGVLAGLAAYVLAGLLLVSGVLTPLAAAMLAAPFALLVPTGLGLLACFGWRRSIPPGIGRVQALLVAWLFGTLAIIYAFVLLERHGLTGKLADPVLASFYVLGAVGCLLLRREFAPDSDDRGTLRLVAAVALPVVIVQYIAEIPVYSEFPVMNLFQRTHFHKGALEFARFDLLNPFVADSYVPFQQLLMGLLARGANVDPILAEWVLPIVMSPLQVGAIFAVACRLTKSNAQLGLAIGLFLAMSSVTNPTNGQVATLAALLFLSFLLDPAGQDKAVREKLRSAFFLVVAIASGLALARMPVVLGFAVLLGAALFVSMPGSSPKATRATIVAIAIFAAISFHRGAMLFVPLVVLIHLAVTFYSRIHRTADARWMTTLSLGSILLVAGMAGWILLLGGELPQDEFGLWSIFDVALNPLAGKSMTLVAVDHDLAQGAGGRISLFEVARSLSLVGAVVGGVLFLRAIWPVIGVRQPKTGNASVGGPGVVLMMVCLLLLAISLTGFPFVHRSAFLIATLLSISVALLVKPPEAQGRPANRRDIAWSIGLLAYMGGVLALVSFVPGQAAAPFLELVSLLLLLLFAAGVSLVAWCLGTKRTVCLGTVLVVAVLFEAIASRAYFKRYAFMNQTPPKGAVLSHFGHQELATADTIAAELGSDTVLVSDPKTMALIGARSGLNSLVSFSNVNTLADETRRELVAFLRNVSLGVPQREICSGLQRISNSYASSQFNYARLKRLGLTQSGSETLSALGYNNALVPRSIAPPRLMAATYGGDTEGAVDGDPTESTAHKGQPFAIVFSPDTLDWLDRPLAPFYFPAQRDISEIADVFPLFGSSGRRVGNAFLLRVRCE